MKAKIEKDKEGKGLWMIIDYDDPSLSNAWPITEDEVEAIRDACNEWLFYGGDYLEFNKEFGYPEFKQEFCNEWPDGC